MKKRKWALRRKTAKERAREIVNEAERRKEVKQVEWGEGGGE